MGLEELRRHWEVSWSCDILIVPFQAQPSRIGFIYRIICRTRPPPRIGPYSHIRSRPDEFFWVENLAFCPFCMVFIRPPPYYKTTSNRIPGGSNRLQDHGHVRQIIRQSGNTPLLEHRYWCDVLEAKVTPNSYFAESKDFCNQRMESNCEQKSTLRSRSPIRFDTTGKRGDMLNINWRR